MDRWFVQDYGGRVFLFSTPDGWIWALSSDRPENPPRFQMMWLHNRVTSGFTPGDAPWRYAGFHHSVFRESPASSIVSYAYAVPHWFLVLITGPPGYGLARSGLLARRRRLRIAYGLCPVCGYDLRASPVRCPECGTPRHAETLHDPI